VAKEKSNRIRSNFNLGGEQAEADDYFLNNAFYRSGDYEAVSSRTDPRCFIVARTGAGKSALLKQLEKDNPDHVVRITPEDLSLPYITDLGVMKYLDSLKINLDPLFIALWKHVFVVELIRHRYDVNTQDAKYRFLANLRDKLRRDSAKQEALDYLDDFEGKFWCEADERVREITEKFSNRINEEGKLGVNYGAELSAGATVDSTSGGEYRQELTDRYQRIVNETQLARLNKMLSVLDEDILDSPHHYTYVIIDDLDRDWVDEGIANDLIRCLIRSVLDLKRVQNLKVLVALRTNIFEQINWRKVQEEKLRSLVLQMKWSRADLVDLVEERVPVAVEKSGLSAVSLSDLLPQVNATRGDPISYMLDRTLMRPRDFLAFLNECFSQGSSTERITWNEIKAAEKAYSQKRLLALNDEWKLNFFGVMDIFNLFHGAEMPMSADRLRGYLDEAALLLANPDFEGGSWLEKRSEKLWADSPFGESWVHLYQPLIQLLYELGFLGVMPPKEKECIYFYNRPNYVEGKNALAEVEEYLIHPAFRASLEITLRWQER
jgi:hypothetical protein